MLRQGRFVKVPELHGEREGPQALVPIGLKAQQQVGTKVGPKRVG